jgi:hypothetical protein
VDHTLLKDPEHNDSNDKRHTSNDAQSYWKSINEVAVEVVRAMDEKEDWVIEDHAMFKESLEKLLALVQEHPAVTEYCLTRPREAFKLMAYLHTSTAMMILHASDAHRPGLIDNFLTVVTELLSNEQEGEVSVAGNLALDRFMAFERSALIQRIFTKDRVDGLVEALGRSGAAATLNRSNTTNA